MTSDRDPMITGIGLISCLGEGETAHMTFHLVDESAPLAVFLAAVILYHAAVVSIFAEAYSRYVDHVMPLALILSALCVGSALQSREASKI